jgi:hypothetical protein
VNDTGYYTTNIKEEHIKDDIQEDGKIISHKNWTGTDQHLNRFFGHPHVHTGSGSED